MSQVDDWVVIDDFTPGIHSDFHQAGSGNSTAQPRNGAATVTGTWRCTADRTGALVPLPRRVLGYSAHPWQTHDPAGYSGGVAQAQLLDAIVMGPISSGDGGALPANPDAVYMLHGMNYDAALGTARRQYILGKAVPQFGATSWDFLFARCNDVIGGTTPSFPHGSLDRSRFLDFEGDDSGFAGYYRTKVVGAFGFDRAPVGGGATLSAAEQVLTTWETLTYMNGAAPSTNTYLRHQFVTPRDHFVPDTTPTRSVGWTGVPALNLAGAGSTLMVTHQGRALFTNKHTTKFFGGGVGWHWHDVVSYTKAGDVQNGDFNVLGDCAAAIFGEENPSPIGVMVSMSAAELLIVKHRAGGVLVRGDVANPQVIKLPGIHPTGGYTMTPANTPFGVFYGTRDGVVRWNGGDTTELVSKQLDGPFWVAQAAADVMEGNRARFHFWHPWVMVSNGYMLNTDTGAWWRLEDPADVPFAYSHYDSSAATGRLYAFRNKITGQGASATPQWDNYTPDVLATTWQWTSQPLIETRDREDSYGEIELVAQRGGTLGTSTVTVTLTGYLADGTQVSSSNVFTLAANLNPQFVRGATNMNFTARFVQVQITVNSGAGSSPAPKVMSVRLGRRAGAHAPRAA